MPNLWKFISRPKVEPYQFSDAAELLTEEPAPPVEETEDVPEAELAHEPAPVHEPTAAKEPSKAEGVRYAQVQAEQIVLDAERQADEIRKRAEQQVQAELEELRESARKEGWEAGYTEGMRAGAVRAEEEGRKKYDEHCKALSDEVRKFLEQANAAADRQMEDNIDELRDLAIAVAEKVICISLKSSSEIIGRMIHAAIDKRKRREWVRIYLAECDTRHMQQLSPALSSALASLSDQVRIVPVADDEPGTCIIEMPDEIIDASATTQLNNIRGMIADVPTDAPQNQFSFGGGVPSRVPQHDSAGL